jgi:hypothetical protein
MPYVRFIGLFYFYFYLACAVSKTIHVELDVYKNMQGTKTIY